MHIVQLIVNGIPQSPFPTDNFQQARNYFIDIYNDRNLEVPLVLVHDTINQVVNWVKSNKDDDGWDINWWVFGSVISNNESLEKSYEFLREMIAYPDQASEKRIYKFLKESNQIQAGFKPMFLEDGEQLNPDGFWDEGLT